MKTERVVSKKELQDFKDKYGQENELRDLLNKERGLTRRRDAKDKLKSPGMNPAEYVSTGKAMVDKQDEEAKLYSSYKPRRPDTKLRDAAFTGDGYKEAQYTNKALSEMGAQTRGPTIGNAKAVEASGGDRSTRSDNTKPVVAEGGKRSVRNFDYENDETEKMKRGGKVKKMASGGVTSSASKRGDGIAQHGKTKGRMV